VGICAFRLALKVLSRMHLPNAYYAAKFLQSFFV
jgi:hypothetical protein